MNLHNTTLQKQGLRRRKEIRRLLHHGRTLQSVATQLGISRQRVHQIITGKGKK